MCMKDSDFAHILHMFALLWHAYAKAIKIYATLLPGSAIDSFKGSWPSIRACERNEEFPAPEPAQGWSGHAFWRAAEVKAKRLTKWPALENDWSKLSWSHRALIDGFGVHLPLAMATPCYTYMCYFDHGLCVPNICDIFFNLRSEELHYWLRVTRVIWM